MKSKKVTKEMLDEAQWQLAMLEQQYTSVANNLRAAKDKYHTLVKRASASVVKEHTLKKN